MTEHISAGHGRIFDLRALQPQDVVNVACVSSSGEPCGMTWEVLHVTRFTPEKLISFRNADGSEDHIEVGDGGATVQAKITGNSTHSPMRLGALFAVETSREETESGRRREAYGIILGGRALFLLDRGPDTPNAKLYTKDQLLKYGSWGLRSSRITGLAINRGNETIRPFAEQA